MDHEPSKYSSSLFYESLNKKWIVDILYWTRLLQPDPSQVIADWSVGQPLPKHLFTFYSQKDQNFFAIKMFKQTNSSASLENLKSVSITTQHMNQLQKYLRNHPKTRLFALFWLLRNYYMYRGNSLQKEAILSCSRNRVTISYKKKVNRFSCVCSLPLPFFLV